MKFLISLGLVIFGIFTLNACDGKKTEDMKYATPRNAGDKITDPSKKPTDSKELTATDKFLIRAIHGHRIAHEIFAELWMQVWEDRMSRPNSVFLDVLQFMEAHRDLKANHFNLKNSQCPERLTQIVVAATSVAFQTADCSDLKSPKWQDVARATILDKDLVQWDIFNQFFPRGAGKHLSNEKNRTKCTFEHLDEKRLASLHCEFVGQSRDNESHMIFTDLDFERKSSNLVTAKAMKYKNGQAACEEPKFCTEIKVPNEGAIEIIENIGGAESGKVAVPAIMAPAVDAADLNALGEVVKPAEESPLKTVE